MSCLPVSKARVARVIAGSPDHRDSVLSDSAQAAGDTMMICVSRSCGDKLTLDL